MLLACFSVARSSTATVYATVPPPSGDASASRNTSEEDRDAGIKPPFPFALRSSGDCARWWSYRAVKALRGAPILGR